MEPQAAGANAELPRVLGRYEVLGELARGGMASVHLGRIRGAGGFERIVAVKCCHAHLSSDPEFVAMFFDEARIAAGIHHPNVVATLDVGSDGPVLYHVMEYVEGERLVDLVKAARRADAVLPIPIVLRVMIDMLHGLHAAHELTDGSGAPLDVVHRDVSPQNVMVGTDGVARIMDFGIARAAARTTVTDSGVVKGKFSYMSPEQLLAQEVDRRTDVFAAGVVLWEAITGRRLFAGDSQGETVQRVLHLPIEPPSRSRPEAAALDEIVLRALARSVDERFATARAFADAIEASGVAIAKSVEVGAHVKAVFGAGDKKRMLIRRAELETPTVESAAAPTMIDQTAPRRSSNNRALGALALLGALLAGAIAWAALDEDEEPVHTAQDPVPERAPSPAAPAPSREPTPATPPPPPATTPSPAPVARPPDATDAPAADEPPSAVRPRPRRTRRRPRTTTAPAAQGSPEYIPRAL